MSMTSVSKVTAESSALPKAELTWEVVLEDPTGLVSDDGMAAATLLYNNLMYDLVGGILGKLGWEYSKLLSGQQDQKAFDETFEAIAASLTAR